MDLLSASVIRGGREEKQSGPINITGGTISQPQILSPLKLSPLLSTRFTARTTRFFSTSTMCLIQPISHLSFFPPNLLYPIQPFPRPTLFSPNAIFSHQFFFLFNFLLIQPFSCSNIVLSNLILIHTLSHLTFFSYNLVLVLIVFQSKLLPFLPFAYLAFSCRTFSPSNLFPIKPFSH